MEDLSKISLDVLLSRGRLDLPACLRIANDLAGALDQFHVARTTYSKVQPANILIKLKKGRVHSANLKPIDSSTHNSLPIAHSAADWAYWSPEQTGRMNRPIDYRTDFYSLGVTLYRMLTGALPFEAADPLEWVHCHVARLPFPLQEVAPDIPQMVSEIVMKLLAKVAEDRYKSASGLQFDLRKCLDQWEQFEQIDYFPLGEHDISDFFLISQKIYGRKEEAATLLEFFDRMTTSGEPQLVLVTGAAGIGKSSLVEELHQSIVGKRGFLVSGKFDQYKPPIPYTTISQAFRELAQQILCENETRIAEWRQQLLKALGNNGQLIIGLIPQIELIIGPRVSVPALPPLEAQHRFQRVFRQFLSVVANHEHPLVLFLDDLQWADMATLGLIEHVLTYPDTRYLMLVGSYRDQELSAAHPLIKVLAAIRKIHTPREIHLRPLCRQNLNELLADTLHCQQETIVPLAELILRKTEGNPFFVNQLLCTLHRDDLITFDLQRREWHWDLNRIEEANVTENVVELMADQINRLPIETQEPLKLAACLGSRFYLENLALIAATTSEQILERLQPAFDKGLLLLHKIAGAPPEPIGKMGCKWLHDRVQQAAYSLIPTEAVPPLHLRIGRTLLNAVPADELPKHLFRIVNHFNAGIALINDEAEKIRVAKLNLAAGRKARESVAYASALNYFTAGIELIGPIWERQYEIAFPLRLERAACELLHGDPEAAIQQTTDLLAKARGNLDKTAVYQLRQRGHLVKGETAAAEEDGIKNLAVYGIELPANPTNEDITAMCNHIRRLLGNRPIDAIKDLASTDDPEQEAIMSLLPVSVYIHPNLGCLHVVRMVALSIEHGNNDQSVMWYGIYAARVLLTGFSDYLEARRYAEVAYALMEKRGVLAHKATAGYHRAMTAFWTEQIDHVVDYSLASFEAAIEIGDLVVGGYCGSCLIFSKLVRGDPLAEINKEAEHFLKYSQDACLRDWLDIATFIRQFIRNLQGLTLHRDTFSDEKFDQDSFESNQLNNRWGRLISLYWFCKLRASYLFGNYGEAKIAADNGRLHAASSGAHIESRDNLVYHALTLAALFDQGTVEQQSEWLSILKTHQKTFLLWSEINPNAFHHINALVCAEIARIGGQETEAGRLYEESLQWARTGRFIQDEALAFERASEFYRTRGFHAFADLYIREACACYARWGAEGKVKQLRAKYPQLNVSLSTRPAKHESDVGERLDFLSLVKSSQAISSEIIPARLLDRLMRTVIESAGAQKAYLILVQKDGLWLAAEAYVQQGGLNISFDEKKIDSFNPSWPCSLFNYVHRSQEKVILADEGEPNPFFSHEHLSPPYPKSVLCMPILRQAELIGLLYLENNLVTDAFTAERLTVLELLVCQAAISLRTAQLYADLRQENMERKRAEGALREQEARLHRLIDSNIIGVFFWSTSGDIIDANDAFLEMVGYTRQDLIAGKIRWADMTPPEYLAADVKAMSEARSDGKCAPYEKVFIHRDGRWTPVLIGSALFEDSQEQGIGFVVDLTERKQAEEKIRYVAQHDALTGLPNRVLFQDRVGQAIAHAHRNGTQVAMLFIDLDGFKDINDSLGHQIGDRLLRLAAEKLQHVMREDDTVARLGGDEFVIIFPIVSDRSEAARVAQKVLEALRHPFILDRHELHVTGSIGISLYPTDGRDSEALMRAADTAMYHAKAKGRDSYQFFTSGLNKAAQRRLTLANQLHQALQREELTLHYQPQVKLESGEIFGAEALIRWRQPDIGFIPPAEFIKVAEETGLIVSVGEWVLRQACKQLKCWRDAGYLDLVISVNLSPYQLQRPGFTELTRNILRDTGVPAASLEMEITEGVLMLQNVDNLAALQQLTGMGIHLSIDDFGTGYSSLTYLQRFPIRALKIDQSFVNGIGHDVNDTAIVTAIIAMAHSLNLKVVAEGVESAEQAAFLKTRGCLLAQGFHFSPAIQADSFLELLRTPREIVL
ncbi:MAG: EAL domain-containing protein [Pseudomonadota bacterium]